MWARNADEQLTFLGARREDPCEERTDEASSVMMGSVQAALQIYKCAGASALWAVAVVRDPAMCWRRRGSRVTCRARLEF